MGLPYLEHFHAPTDVAAALASANAEGNTLFLAGGTWLHGLEARSLLGEVKALIDLRKAGLDSVSEDAEGLRIGATVTFATLLKDERLGARPGLAALVDALNQPPVQIRNTATFGGSIAAACPFFDVPTALVALGATAQVQGKSGRRVMPVEEVSAGLFQNALAGDEVITSITLPGDSGRWVSAFEKLETNALDLAIVNAAVCLKVDAEGQCAEARVALGGGVGETVRRSPAAEAILKGARLTSDVLERASAAVDADIDPISDHRASARYRRALAKVMTKRALQKALARLDAGSQGK